MARVNAANFSGALQFPYANAATDLFKKEDVQVLALATDSHDHTPGKGLILPTSAIPPITSAMIVDGTITGADIGTGQITNALMAANSVGISQLIGNSVHAANVNTPGSFSTTSASLVASSLVTSYNASAGMVGILAIAMFAWNNPAVSTANYFQLMWNGTATNGNGYYITNANASYGQMGMVFAWVATPAVTTYTAQLYFACNGGTLTIPYSSILAIGFNR